MFEFITHLWKKLSPTNLTRKQRKRLQWKHSKKIDGCRVNFWVKRGNWSIFNSISEHTINLVLRTVDLNQNFGSKFNILDLIFQELPLFPSKGVKKFEKYSSSLGYVTCDEIDADRNIVYLNIDSIYARDFNKLFGEHYPHQDSISQVEGKELKYKTEARFQESLIDVLVHELSHVWHIKRSQANKIFKKNKKRLELAAEIENPYYKLFLIERLKDFDFVLNEGGYNEIDLTLMRSTLLDFYILLRTKILDFEIKLVKEGVAVFMETYMKEHEQRDFEKFITQGEKDAKLIKKTLTEIIRHFSTLAKCIHRNKTFDFKKFPEKGEKEIKAQKEIFEKFVSIIEKYLKNLEITPYDIGPALITVLFSKGNLHIREIGKLKPNGLLRKYAEVCNENNITPFISVVAGEDAIVNIRDATISLNKIRKKYEITTFRYEYFKLGPKKK